MVILRSYEAAFSLWRLQCSDGGQQCMYLGVDINEHGSKLERGATLKFWPRGGPIFQLEGGYH